MFPRRDLFEVKGGHMPLLGLEHDNFFINIINKCKYVQVVLVYINKNEIIGEYIVCHSGKSLVIEPSSHRSNSYYLFFVLENLVF